MSLSVSVSSDCIESIYVIGYDNSICIEMCMHCWPDASAEKYDPSIYKHNASLANLNHYLIM